MPRAIQTYYIIFTCLGPDSAQHSNILHNLYMPRAGFHPTSNILYYTIFTCLGLDSTQHSNILYYTIFTCLGLDSTQHSNILYYAIFTCLGLDSAQHLNILHNLYMPFMFGVFEFPTKCLNRSTFGWGTLC